MGACFFIKNAYKTFAADLIRHLMCFLNFYRYSAVSAG